MQIRPSQPVRLAPLAPRVAAPVRPVAAPVVALDVLAAEKALAAKVKGWLSGLVDRLFNASYTPEKPAAPSGGDRLRVANYNAMLGGKDMPGVKATLKRLNPDVVALQEISRGNAEKLARELGMHMVYYGTGKVPFMPQAGKAILSKYPIESSGHRLFEATVGDHMDAVRRHAEAREQPVWKSFFTTELTERRGVLEAVIRVNGKPVRVMDTHMTLGDASLNALQLRSLAERAKAAEARGEEVLLMGDFNTNLALGTADQGPAVDTVAEYRTRYGKGPGNIGDAGNMAAADQLRGTLSSSWDTAAKRFSITEADAELTPEEARAALATATPKSPEWQRLAAAADGFTHLGANKRFDNILVSEGVKVEQAAIDLMSKASDHQAVVTDVTIGE